MTKRHQRKLNFLSGFENSSPDAYHHVDFTYAEEWIKGKCILNIGCWTGSFENLSSGYAKKAFALDQNLKALAVGSLSLPSVSFVNGNLFELPFQDCSVDVVLLFTVFEHLEGREQDALREIHRVLTPVGKLILSTPHSYWLHGIMDVAHWMVGHRHFCKKEIQNYLKSTGFTLVKLDLRGKWVSTLCIPLFYLAKYFLRINIYKTSLYIALIRKEYSRSGFRDIYLVAEKSRAS